MHGCEQHSLTKRRKGGLFNGYNNLVGIERGDIPRHFEESKGAECKCLKSAHLRHTL